MTGYNTATHSGGGGGEGGDGKWGYRGGWVKVRKGRLGVSFFLFLFFFGLRC